MNTLLSFCSAFLFLLVSILPAQASNSGFAVVLIDMQIGFYERGGVTDTPGLKALVAKDQELLRWAVEQDIPVMVFEYEDFGPTDPKLMKILEGHEHVVIEKDADGAFETYQKSREQALAQLKAWNVDTLIFAGINGDACVLQTALGALQAGFEGMSSSDIVGNLNQNPPIHPNSTWFFENKKFVVFRDLEDIIR